MKPRFLILFLFVVSNSFLSAQIKLASVFGDNMVLQRNSEVKIWGKASAGQKLTVTPAWSKMKVSVTTDEKGNWTAKLKTIEAGGPYTITIASGKQKVTIKNILLGEVWLCSGQSNMEMQMALYADQPVNGANDELLNAIHDDIRLFTVTRNSQPTTQDTCSGKWQVATAESVAVFSAVGYFYAKQLQQRLHVPVGIICSSWGGSRIEAWMSKEVVSQFGEAYQQTTKPNINQQNKAAHLFNGMIAPLLNLTIKGVIWYQGESNINNYKDYVALQAAMVKDWRSRFGIGEFPFYYVQIAPFWYYKNTPELYSAFQRDEQLKAMSVIPNSGMVCTLDIGDEKCIHPAEKQTVGKRLALWALAETYNFKGFSYKSPTFNSMTVKDSVAIISFNDAPTGITSFGKSVDCFQISGTDSIFYPAKLEIKNKQALLKSLKVKSPVAVRYAFCNFPKTEGYLYNTAGFPALSFRTDNWNNKK